MFNPDELMGMVLEQVPQEIRPQLKDIVDNFQHQADSGIITGEAGAGLVKVTVNIRNNLRGVEIDPSILEGKEAKFIGDLIMSAYAAATSISRYELERAQHEMMAKIGSLIIDHQLEEMKKKNSVASS